MEEEGKVDIWTENKRSRIIDVRVPPQYLHEFTTLFFDKLHIPYQIFIGDIQKLIDEEIKSFEEISDYKRGDLKSRDEFFSRFRKLEEVYDWLRDMQSRFPQISSLIVAGQSYENRTILGIKIEGNNRVVKPAVLFTGTIHAREWIATSTVCWIINHFLTKYQSDEKIKRLVDNISWHIFPVVNPDGYVYTQTDRMWRKTRRPPPAGTCYGVDCNRNWAYKWNSGGSSTNPCSQTYHGSGPFSEPETLAQANYAKKMQRLSFYVDYHSYSQFVMRPWAFTSTPPPEEPELKKVGDAIANAITQVHKERYTSGRWYSILYPSSGTNIDWMLNEFKIPSFTIELRDRGQRGFIQPPEAIKPTGEENVAGVLVMGEYILGKYRK